MKLLTNSEMRVWRRCRRQWWLSQHRGLRTRNVDFNRPTGIGNRVHDCLAAYYDPETRRDPLETLRESVQRDVAAHPEHEDAIRKEADLCDAMLSGYMEWLAETGADQALTVVEAEKAVIVPLVEQEPDGVQLLSKLDARVQHDEYNSRLALEHKTVQSITPPAVLRIDTQFLTEHLAEFLDLRRRGRGDETADGVLWNGLRKSKRTARAKGPFYHREPVRHNVQQLRSHWYHVLIVATEIQTAAARLDSGEDHHVVAPPNPTADCSWDCPFLKVCGMFDDGSDVEGAIRENYDTGDPLERYKDILPDDVKAARGMTEGDSACAS